MFIATIIGNLGRDAELINGNNNRVLTKLAVGVDQGKDKPTLWPDVLMPQNPNLMPYLTKGTKVCVVGRCDVQMRSGYVNVTIFADQLQLVGDRRDTTPPAATEQAPEQDPLM